MTDTEIKELNAGIENLDNMLYEAFQQSENLQNQTGAEEGTPKEDVELIDAVYERLGKLVDVAGEAREYLYELRMNRDLV